MKLVRYGPAGQERPGAVDKEGRLRTLSPLVADVTVELLEPAGRALLAAVDVERLPLVEGEPRLGVPVADIRQVIAIGLNYADHAAEGGVDVPEYPLVFGKSLGSLSGSTDPIEIPDWATEVDWEIELAFLIGTAAREVEVDQALAHVAGYCGAIDVSERALQQGPGGQVGHGKSLDTFTPVGPWFVTADEISDPQDLAMSLKVNGEIRQDGSTAGMLYTVARIISYMSRYQTLLPGDLVITGTPAGIGWARTPQQFLRPGDRVESAIDGLCAQDHAVVARGEGRDHGA